MKKILIVSDSHSSREPLQTLMERHICDHYIHCGDSELSNEDEVLAGYDVVKGNCDFQADFPNELIIELGVIRMYITHGHLYDVKRNLLSIQYRAEELGANVVCFGHSHIAYAEQKDGMLFLNPGSIRLPKYFSEPSYIILKVFNENEVHVQFYNDQGRELTTFPYNETFCLE